MTVESTHSSPRSRRALLAGALGGLGAWLAAAATHLDPADAAVGDPIRMGRLNKASGTSTELQTSTSKPAFVARQLGAGAGVRGEAESGRAVMGVAGSEGTGVWAYSPDHYGVHSTCPNGEAILAISSNDRGVSAFGGRYGVWTQSPQVALYAYSNNVAAELWGRVLLYGHQEFVEVASDPEVTLANSARVFARDNGSGKTQLCVRFPTGAVQVIATEP